jgi:hypothetical protein
MGELIARFLIGGTIISVFAMLGEVLRPKSFAGLFGAAPSIALATIGLTIAKQGREYAATEARSMMLGAIAFVVYAFVVSRVLIRYRPSTMAVTLGLLPVWLAVSLGLWWVMLR